MLGFGLIFSIIALVVLLGVVLSFSSNPPTGSPPTVASPPSWPPVQFAWRVPPPWTPSLRQWHEVRYVVNYKPSKSIFYSSATAVERAVVQAIFEALKTQEGKPCPAIGRDPAHGLEWKETATDSSYRYVDLDCYFIPESAKDLLASL